MSRHSYVPTLFLNRLYRQPASQALAQYCGIQELYGSSSLPTSSPQPYATHLQDAFVTGPANLRAQSMPFQRWVKLPIAIAGWQFTFALGIDEIPPFMTRSDV